LRAQGWQDSLGQADGADGPQGAMDKFPGLPLKHLGVCGVLDVGAAT
jgi:hypothetical protein